MNDNDCLKNILNGVASAYIFILILKIYFRIIINSSLGKYVHSLEESDSIIFCIRFNYLDFLSPVPRISLNIFRAKGNDSEDWSGKYYSDMLNPYKFMGIYVKDGLHITENRLGYHEIILFPKQKIIALMMHYVSKDEKGNKFWKTTDGYFIFKDINCH